MAEATLRSLRLKRGKIRGVLTRFQSFINSSEAPDKGELEIRLEAVKPLLSSFEDVQLQLELLDEAEHDSETLVQFENAFYSLTAKARGLLTVPCQVSSPISFVSDQNSTQLKLPKIELPKFNGTHTQWTAFSSTFEALVHLKTNLSNIEKFHYLRSVLVGNAARIIEPLAVSGDNYQIAWDLLQTRFANKYLIVTEHLAAMFNLRPMVRESGESLRALVDAIETNLRALKTLNVSTDNWDIMLVFLINTKLDLVTKKDWETERAEAQKELPRLQDLLEFLHKKCQTAEALQRNKIHSQGSVSVGYDKQPTHKPRNSVNISFNQSCAICKGTHFIFNCPAFLKLSGNLRIQEAKRRKLCLNCLRPNHVSAECSSGTCRLCGQKHNTLLHLSVEKSGSNLGSAPASPQQTNASTTPGSSRRDADVAYSELTEAPSSSNHSQTTCQTQVLLPTAVAQVFNRFGNKHECRILLDVGSQSNFIRAELADMLGLTKSVVNIPIVGIAQNTTHVKHSVNANIKSRINSFCLQANCLVVPTITSDLPALTIEASLFNIPKNITLADPAFNVTRQIDILLGAGVFWKLLCVGQIDGSPLLQKTLFGWVAGSSGAPRSAPVNCNLCLETQVAKFWELEEVVSKPARTAKEEECETHFIQSHSHDNTGRFIVRLPFKDTNKSLGQSRPQAIKRLAAMEKKFAQNSQLKEQYCNFMREYLQLGHMTPIHNVPDTERTYYLPHHAVGAKSETQIKFRVVFDASSKTSNGKSLNDLLAVGPVVQSDLVDILIRFRMHAVVLVADIQKMYRQINVDTRDQEYQKIVWRFDASDPIQTYQLNTVTYGTACAPFLATRCLQQVAVLAQQRNPSVSRVIQRDFYVDDLLTGTGTIEDAIALKQGLIAELQQYGFPLCKWRTNVPKVLSTNHPEGENTKPFSFDVSDEAKTLGLIWNNDRDVFKYSITVINNPVTKRSVLATIARVFDPLGLLGPVLTTAKILLQEIWSLQLHWDASLPVHIHNRWLKYIQELQGVPLIEIPRQVTAANADEAFELHGFADASELAYGAAVYVTTANQQNYMRLLCSKSRVAPLKRSSIPRLELCAALLLARLLKKVTAALDDRVATRAYCWTDSTVALAWITSSSSHWQTFVANRVAEIQTLTTIDQWGHVRSEDNPADCLSRELSSEEIKSHDLWWSGPAWLCNTIKFPDQPITFDTDSEQVQCEKRKSVVMTVTSEPISMFNRYSSFAKLQGVFAVCLRFIFNCRNATRRSGHITASEIHQARLTILRLVQATAFPREIRAIRLKKTIHASPVVNLNPFVGADDLLRVGGRLTNAYIPHSQQCPIILPKGHAVTKLIVREIHLNHLHAGTQATLDAVRRHYWPLGGRSTVRQTIHACVPCFRAKPRGVVPIMGQLPSYRVQPSPPFTYTGVDYAGPMLLKDSVGRGKKTIKAYIALFICLATKAIHVELVRDLTTEGFLAALKRFMARRGKVAHLYSDNATNFVGAEKELKRLFDCATVNSRIQPLLKSENIQWHFIPPRAPHFGGLWEAGVRGVKQHIRRVLGDTLLTFDEFNTLLCQIEACLNSRPLTPLSSDPSDLSALTPGHFLIGRPITTNAEPDLTMVKINRLSRWQQTQHMFQHFWKRWSSEYLHTLLQRPKWRQSVRPIQINDLVLVKDDNHPPFKWPLGRVTALHPGADRIVRVVTIKTLSGEAKRPVAKIFVLPIDTTN